MTTWYGPGANSGGITGQGGYWVANPDGSMRWVANTGAQASYNGQGTAPTGGHWQPQGDGTSIFVYDDPAMQAPTVSGPGPTGNQTTPPPNLGWGTGYGGQPPPSGWGTGFTGGTPRAESPFATITGQQQAYYQLNPDLANNLLRSWLAPNANSPFAGYIDSRMPDLQKQYAVASGEGGNTGLQYTDWLKQNYGQLASGFANLSQSQRGENPIAFGGGFAGRFTG